MEKKFRKIKNEGRKVVSNERIAKRKSNDDCKKKRKKQKIKERERKGKKKEG